MVKIEIGICRKTIFNKLGWRIKYYAFTSHTAAIRFIEKINGSNSFIWHILVNGKEVEKLDLIKDSFKDLKEGLKNAKI